MAAPAKKPSKVVSTIDGEHEIRFADGGRYKGQWQEGMPHGMGASVSPVGDCYTGEFVDGLPHGRGVHVWVSGERYEGEYRHGKQHGQGRWSHPAGDVFEGGFEDDKRHGFGVYRTAAGRTWAGEWRHGRQYQKTDHYGETVGGVVYQSVGGGAAAVQMSRVPNPAPGWAKGAVAGPAAATYDVVVNRQAAPEGAYDVVVNHQAASGGQYDVVVRKDATYDSVGKPK